MAQVHLIEGPVGAGKSTYARALSRRAHAPHLNLDDWMTRLFRPDRPAAGVMEWYVERKLRCVEQIWRTALVILEADTSVVLELGLIQQALREPFFERVDESGHGLRLHVLDAPIEVRRERVRARNDERGDTFSVEVPDAFFEMASAMWEPLDEVEYQDRDVVFVDTDDG